MQNSNINCCNFLIWGGWDISGGIFVSVLERHIGILWIVNRNFFAGSLQSLFYFLSSFALFCFLLSLKMNTSSRSENHDIFKRLSFRFPKLSILSIMSIFSSSRERTKTVSTKAKKVIGYFSEVWIASPILVPWLSDYCSDFSDFWF